MSTLSTVRVGLLIAGGLFLGAAWAQQQGPEEHHPGRPEQAGQAAAKQPAGPMAEMCSMHMNMMATLKDTLAQAKQAAEAGNAEQAARKIGEAQDLIEKQHAAMHEKMQGRMGEMMSRRGEGSPMKCSMCGQMMGKSGQATKDRCPMDGNKVDANRLTSATKREHQGEKVGFCCPGCARQWDQLSSAEKQSKSDSLAARQKAQATRPAVGSR